MKEKESRTQQQPTQPVNSIKVVSPAGWEIKLSSNQLDMPDLAGWFSYYADKLAESLKLPKNKEVGYVG